MVGWVFVLLVVVVLVLVVVVMRCASHTENRLSRLDCQADRWAGLFCGASNAASVCVTTGPSLEMVVVVVVGSAEQAVIVMQSVDVVVVMVLA